MSQEILNKIKYLCKNIPKVEWSGVLFYSVEGSIKETDTFEVHLEDILPLDMGSKAYTEYELDDRFIDYLMEDPIRMSWRIGHIHSHNDMNVFFSHVDISELKDNCVNHDYYVSLIVNNFMEFSAKIAFTGSLDKKVNNVPYMSMDENGQSYVLFKTQLTYEKTKMFTYDCEIISQQEDLIVEEPFVDKVKEIMKPKPVPVIPVSKVFPPANAKPVVQKTPTQLKIINKVKFGKLDKTKVSDRVKKLEVLLDDIPFDEYEDLTDDGSLSMIELFTAELMKVGVGLEAEENLEDVLMTVEDSSLDAYEYAKKVLDFYGDIYDKYFPDTSDDEFLKNSNEVCDLLYDCKAQFPFINVTIKAIEAMLVKFKANVTTAI